VIRLSILLICARPSAHCCVGLYLQMSNPYQAPSSESREDLPARTFMHCVVGAVSGFIAVYVIVFGTSAIQIDELPTLSVMAICSIVTGGLLRLLRNLKLLLAMLAGPPITIVTFFATVLVADQFGVKL
jgi:hypothetical protein